MTINFIPLLYLALSNKSRGKKKTILVQSHGNQTGNLKVWSVNNNRCSRQIKMDEGYGETAENAADDLGNALFHHKGRNQSTR